MTTSPIKGDKAEAPLSPSLTPRRSAARDAFVRNEGLIEEVAKRRFSEIMQAQPEEGFVYLPAGERGEVAATVGKEQAIVPKAKIGQGTFSDVYSASYYPFVRRGFLSPSKPNHGLAMKVGKTSKVSFNYESSILHSLRPSTGAAPMGIDWFFMTGRMQQNNRSFSIHNCYDADFSNLNFAKIASPVTFLAPRFAQIASGLNLLHQSGYVHRDIKPLNLLLCLADHRKSAAITDWGSLALEKHERHAVSGTAKYMDPATYESSIDQKKFIGRQTKEGDIYGLGRSIEDTLVEICKAKASQTTDEDALQAQIKRTETTLYSGPFGEDDLEEYVQKFANCVFYASNGQSETIGVIASYSERKEAFASLWDTFAEQKVFSAEHIEGLRSLTACALSMQNPDLPKRSDASCVLNELCSISRELEVDLATFGLESKAESASAGAQGSLKREGEAIPQSSSEGRSESKRARLSRRV